MDTAQHKCAVFNLRSILAEKGWLTGFGCVYRSLPKAQKAIVFHRTALDPHAEQYLRYAKARGLVTIYDTDDLLFDENAIEHLSSPELGGGNNCGSNSAKAYRAMMEKCNVILVSTNYLQKRAESFHPDVRVIKNGLSKEFVSKAECVHNGRRLKQNNMVTIAYLSGSKHHDDDFQLVEHALINILNDFPEVRLLVMGKLRYSTSFTEFGERFQYNNFVPYRDFCRVFQDIDINIAPLDVSKPFAQARSELKYVEAGLFGIPTIASPTYTYRETIYPGINGLLAEDGEWYDALKALINNEKKRDCLGRAAREDIIANFGPEKRSNQWNKLLSDILEKYGKNRHPNDLKSFAAYTRVLCYWLWRKAKISKKKWTSANIKQ